jgi:hypothetical protein
MAKPAQKMAWAGWGWDTGTRAGLADAASEVVGRGEAASRGEGVAVSEGVVRGEGVATSEGVVRGEGVAKAEGVVGGEGVPAVNVVAEEEQSRRVEGESCRGCAISHARSVIDPDKEMEEDSLLNGGLGGTSYMREKWINIPIESEKQKVSPLRQGPCKRTCQWHLP